MFRYLSPQVGSAKRHEQMLKLKQTITNTTPIVLYKDPLRKEVNERPIVRKQKQTKIADALPKEKTAHVNSSAYSANSNKRIDIKTSSSKNGMFFNNYQEKKLNVQDPKVKKQQISLSGDLYQSEGFGKFSIKLNSPKSFTYKLANQQMNNKPTTPANGNRQSNGFKASNISSQEKNISEKQILVKKINSLGEKLLVGHFFGDGESYNKKNLSGMSYKVNSQLANTHLKKQHLLDQRSKNNKQSTSNEGLLKGKNYTNSKNVPKFIANSSVKSSPYLNNKITLDSSKEVSGDTGIKVAMIEWHRQKQHREKEREREKQLQKSLSFNREEMFLNLKRRHQQNSLQCKDLSILGVMIELRLISAEDDKRVKLTLIKRISESEKTGIYTAYHQSTAFLYCLKRIPILQMGKSLLDSSIRQHKIQLHCSHPHLVKGFFSAYDSHYLYIAMEFMEGETLGIQLMKNTAKQGSIKTKINDSLTTQITKINKIRKVLFELLGAVAYLHERSIVHRDIKPDNVFVSHNNYKLGDFGSSAKVGQLQYVGTLDYAAPQILSQSSYDQKVDIWSLGCIAYELDVGKPPFFHLDPEQTKRLAVKAEYDRSLLADNELRILIEKMLQVNRYQRASARQLLKDDFFQDLHEKNAFF